ncbi:DNA replication ATP-dependent helicase/nuclease DNA2-like [Artemia franciscana]|uniref:DNA replication ATP-dependent helicase/nuclease DNA2-like n=1 Tax=Artemia franciscana TaxID=6661 RepID=UPI0032DA721D
MKSQKQITSFFQPRSQMKNVDSTSLVFTKEHIIEKVDTISKKSDEPLIAYTSLGDSMDSLKPENKSLKGNLKFDPPAFNTRNSPKKFEVQPLVYSPLKVVDFSVLASPFLKSPANSPSKFSTPEKNPLSKAGKDNLKQGKTPSKTPRKSPSTSLRKSDTKASKKVLTPLKGQQTITSFVQNKAIRELDDSLDMSSVIMPTPSPSKNKFTKINNKTSLVRKRLISSNASEASKKLKLEGQSSSCNLMTLKSPNKVGFLQANAIPDADVHTTGVCEVDSDMNRAEVFSDSEELFLESLDFAQLESSSICQQTKNEKEAKISKFRDGGLLGKRHKVEDVKTYNNGEIYLQVSSLADRKQRLCILRGSWAQTLVRKNDIVNLECDWHNDIGVVDDMKGLVVVNPDFFLTGTSIVSAMYCPRKTILAERFKCCIGAPDQSNFIMLVGTLGHELLQMVLKRKCYNRGQIILCLDEVVNSPSVLFGLCGLNKDVNDIRREVESFIPQLEFFIQRYMKGQNVFPPTLPSTEKRTKPASVWSGRISQLKDIEENVWSARYGMKGKIDVSFEVENQGKKRVLPLEVKTGRSSFSAEHKGQVIIYCMAREELNDDPTSGLLFYLRDGAMQEIPAGVHEKRGLIQLRNELSYYVSAVPSISRKQNEHFPETNRLGKNENKRPGLSRLSSTEVNSLSIRDIEDSVLPPALDDKRRCESCEYNVVCSIYQRTQNDVPEPPHNMAYLVPTLTKHLTDEDLEFFKKWTSLLRIEQTEAWSRSSLKDLWTISSIERQKKGSCIANLRVASSTSENGDEWRSELVKTKNYQHEALTGVVQIGDSLVVSTKSKLAIDIVHVTTIENEKIHVLGERDLHAQLKEEEEVFLDKTEFGNATGILYGNLMSLFQDNSVAERIRKLVVHRSDPSARKLLPKEVAVKGKKALRSLNVIQQKALLKSLLANDYLLIKGMPGTGKTSLIVGLIEISVQLGKSVLVTAYTHSAVDNILLKLKARNVDFIRIGKTSRIHHEILPYSEATLTQDIKSVKDLEAFYKSKLVVGTTCLNMGNPALYLRQFDLCIVDEAAQALLPATLGPLFYSKKWILVGDSHQLPPVVSSRVARSLGLDISLFSHLETPDNTVFLNIQYRMNQVITDLANYMTYDGKLECGNEEVANAVLRLPNEKSYRMSSYVAEWISNACDTSLSSSVIMLDTVKAQALETKPYDEIINVGESQILYSLIDYLIKCGLSQKDIGVIAPYQGQVKYVRRFLASKQLSLIEVNTVDQYQGRDKEVILYSCCKTSPIDESESQILQDERRLNVAVTRAKHKLIIVGHGVCLRKYIPFSKLIDFLERKKSIFSLEIGTDGFTELSEKI